MKGIVGSADKMLSNEVKVSIETRFSFPPSLLRAPLVGFFFLLKGGGGERFQVAAVDSSETSQCAGGLDSADTAN